MYSCVIICRSQTEAQKVSTMLRNTGINAYVIKPPRDMLINSCTYGVKLEEAYLNESLMILKSAGFAPKNIYTVFNDGSTVKH